MNAVTLGWRSTDRSEIGMQLSRCVSRRVDVRARRSLDRCVGIASLHAASSNGVVSWLHAFLLTLAVEVPLAVAVVRVPGSSWLRIALVAVLASTISHPILTFVLVPYVPGPFVARVIVGELVVVAIETVVFRRGLAIRWPHALAVSALLNGASFMVGLALYG
jgi:hypothetical protein